MAAAVLPPSPDLVHSYRMVSQRYLDLTRQKLELVRLPQAPRNAKSSDAGVSKDDLEPIIDHWLEAYNWRKQEDYYNDVLPQFRVPINSTRLHFAHKRSRMPTAVPLLFIHGVPETFISVAKMIDILVDPFSSQAPGDHLTAFHVVAPSIPGMGFSDPVPERANNIQSTCDIFDALMKGLGYGQYIVHGSGWGFNIARAIALLHPESCMAVHTVNPDVPVPRAMGFGYNAIESAPSGVMQLQASGSAELQPAVPHPTSTSTIATPDRPQTAAYALCDSPAGLLAYVYEAIRPEQNSKYGSPADSRSPESLSSHSPLSTPSYAHSYAASTPGRSTASSSPVATRRQSLAPNPSPPKQPSSRSSPTTHGPVTATLASDSTQPWPAKSIIDWTMLYWLPGPEVALRWLANSTPFMPTYWASHCMVPLGISHFRDPAPVGHSTGTGNSPLEWAEAYHRVAMVRRREGRVRFPAWEVPAELATDLREFVGLLGLFSATPAPVA